MQRFASNTLRPGFEGGTAAVVEMSGTGEVLPTFASMREE